ncbi:aquaporin-like protein [Karstenula rhodostoma CBS 690.94]|uniref:Aquaporin-like protein n=1 Tax=Karstenula rhodostoma CBS 690.94 TaxID=1392251 RepID=A0A9P4UFE4_9PLEO|nr:aquaporin-like protein [Karstenula rhodostoma CBS 690.94]
MSSAENLNQAQPLPGSEPRPTMSYTGSSVRPSGLTQRTSTQATRQRRGEMERQPTVGLDRMQTADTMQDRNDAGSKRQSNRAPTQDSQRPQQYLQRQQTQKKAEDTYYVDNDYYSLNPWYEQQPPKPLFSLGRPFPRTVRPGMLWGHKRSEHPDQQEQGQGQEGTPGAQTLQIPPQIDEHGEPQAPPDHQYDQHDQQKTDTSTEAHQGLQSPTLMPDSMGDNFHGDHPPLDDLQSVATAETHAEKREIRQREEAAIQDYYNTYRNPLSRFRARYPEAFAEFLSTTVYLFFGLAGGLYSITYPAAEGDYITQSWAWGLAVTAGIYIGGGVSGSHMNPWVSIAFSVFRGFPWKMCAVYCCMQILAGFAAGALAWFIYRDAILHIDPTLTPSITGKALYTIPATYVSVPTAFFNDFLSAALYTCVAFAIGDDSNTPPGSGMSALIYGLMSFLLCICFGYNGLGVSPARDLGPRFVAWWVGYGPETFSSGWWAYGPVAAGLSGALTGALVYDVFVFVGGESPVNYQWPSVREVGKRVTGKKRREARGDEGEV